VKTATDLLARWQAGDQDAAQELFRQYVGRLVALARSRLSDKMAARIDPEDVVQSAYRSFFAHARDGDYDLRHGGDLWQLLLSITLHKLHDQVKRHSAKKRAVEQEVSFSSEDSLQHLQPHLAASEPSPVEALALVDEVEGIMRALSPVHRRIVELRLQGHTVPEIAVSTDRCPHTVRRVLEQVKRDLQQDRGSGTEP
jgi:RNA polymerase sigma-70 factor (ECF subfamily)